MTAIPLRIRPVIPAVLSFLLSLAVSAPARATIQYAVSLEHPEKHLFQVTMTIPNVTDEVTVQMAAWNTLYQIRDFSSHVQQVEAFATQLGARFHQSRDDSVLCTESSCGASHDFHERCPVGLGARVGITLG